MWPGWAPGIGPLWKTYLPKTSHQKLSLPPVTLPIRESDSANVRQRRPRHETPALDHTVESLLGRSDRFTHFGSVASLAVFPPNWASLGDSWRGNFTFRRVASFDWRVRIFGRLITITSHWCNGEHDFSVVTVVGKFALSVLALPFSNAAVERTFRWISSNPNFGAECIKNYWNLYCTFVDSCQ